MNASLEKYRCPTTGQPCTRGTETEHRNVTARRWTGGSVKAATCTLTCAEKWAQSRGYIVTGSSETHGPGDYSAVVIVQHPDQVSGSIKTVRHKS